MNNEQSGSVRPQLAEGLRRFDPITVIGAGTIGISWTALFLAHGFEVRVNDPRPDLTEFVAKCLEDIKPTLKNLGLPTEGLTDRLVIEPVLERAVAGAAVIQENGPERIEFKRELYVKLEQIVGKNTLLLSSSSGLKPTDISSEMEDAGRMLIGHPFNPPHVLPLVEIIPGQKTDPSAVEDAIEFYRALGKNPLVLNKEIDGFVANRLQAAIFREAVHLVLEGVVGINELDEVVTSSIGLRWAVGGPFESFHLGGGKGGLPAFLKHLGPGLNYLWEQLGQPQLDEENVKKLSQLAEEAFVGTSIEKLEFERDRSQLDILATFRKDS